MVMEVADFQVGIDTAFPLSLIINELITNALKYAFPGERRGTIFVGTEARPPSGMELVIRDDGVGLPMGFSMETSASLGMQLVRGLAQQIGGVLMPMEGSGTGFRLFFDPGYRLR